MKFATKRSIRPYPTTDWTQPGTQLEMLLATHSETLGRRTPETGETSAPDARLAPDRPVSQFGKSWDIMGLRGRQQSGPINATRTRR